MLYQNTSNYGPGVEISPMLWGLGFHIEIKETVRATALLFSMKHLLVDLYQVCTYDAPGVKYGGPGVKWGQLSHLVYSISLWTSTNFFI